ncbi:MAG: CPBP family intramembrane metalloprotease [Bacteroidales bacterium]|nr:CPBP family intramembrane metalloprotease [Bacteroidales bacterium]
MSEGTGVFPLYSKPPAIQFLVIMVVILLSSLLVMGAGMLLSLLVFDPGMTVSDILSGESGGTGRSYLLYSQVISQFAVFLIPGLIISWMMTGDGIRWLGIDRPMEAGVAFLVLLLAGTIIPLTSAAGYLNSGMELPECLSRVEEWMRVKEEQALVLTGRLVYAESAGGLAVNIFVLAILPAVAEEVLFRGVIQNNLERWVGSGIVAVIITSLLFSTLHLQFFTFLPRFLLGIVFGFLYLWSRTIWLPVIAHFGNNIVPVVWSYFRGWDYLNESASDFVPADVWQLAGMIIVPSALLGVLYMLVKKRE